MLSEGAPRSDLPSDVGFNTSLQYNPTDVRGVWMRNTHNIRGFMRLKYISVYDVIQLQGAI
jgi:hypothetical protein